MKTIKEDAPVNSGGSGIAQGSGGSNTNTVAGFDKKLKKKVVRRLTFLEYSKEKL